MLGARRGRTWVAVGLAALLAAGPGAAPARARDQADVTAALRWLAQAQGADGSWGQVNKLAITGMAGLALLASGSTPQRGPYAQNITRALQFVLATQAEDKKALQHASSGYSAIHNHGYALLFLTQAYGEGGPLDERLRRAIEGGVQATIESQRRNGGFSYFLYDRPPPRNDMWREDEASTTISQIQALRGARNGGFQVARQALEQAGAYISRSQHPPTGGFYYSIGSTPPRVSFIEGDDRPTFAITAAATAVLHALGTYQGPALERGIAYMEAFIPPSRRKTPFFYYAHYYAAQVMHLEGGPRGERWMKAIRAELAARQRPDGSWPTDPEDTLAAGDSQLLNTAWALQILLIDSGALPIHER